MGTAAAKSARRGVTPREAAAAQIRYAARDRAKWPDLARAAGLHPKNGTARRARDDLLRTGDLVAHEDGTLSLDAAYALPTGRELARPPSDPERRARTNFAQMDEVFTTGRDDLLRVYKGAQNEQIRDLVKQIDEAADAAALASLTATPVPATVVEPHLAAAAAAGVGAARSEREEQIGAIADPPVEPDDAAIQTFVRERAEAVVIVLAQGLSVAAAKRAAAISTKPAHEIAAEVQRYLEALSDAELELQLGGAVMQAYNVGRREFMRAQEIGPELAAAEGTLPANMIRQVLYASELLDGATCQSCAGVDGTEYASVAEAELDYPIGGYVYCEGGLRCRGTLVAIYTEEGASLPQRDTTGVPKRPESPRETDVIEPGGIPPIPERHAPRDGELSVDDLLANNARQRESYEQLLEAAVEPRAGRFIDDTKQLADARAKPGEPVVLLPGPKNAESIANKLLRKQGKYGTEGITDINRSTILVDDLSEIPRAFNDFRKAAEDRGWQLAEYEDAFTGASKGGYRDLSILVKRPGQPDVSSFMEVQFQVNDMWAAKGSKQGHDLYDQLKDLGIEEIEARKAGDLDLIAAVKRRMEPIEKEMTGMYERTWGGIDQASLPRWQRPAGRIDDYVVQGKLPRLFDTGLKEGTDQLGRVFDWPSSRQTGGFAREDKIVISAEEAPPKETWEALFDPNLGEIRYNESLLDRTLYAMDGTPFKPLTKATARHDTVHEFGHRLDWRIGDFIGEKNGFMTEVADLVQRGRLIDEIAVEMPVKKEMKALFAEFRKSPWRTELTERLKERMTTRKFAGYLNSPEELFARATAQYVARKVGDTEALAAIQEKWKRELAGWSEDQFAPIEEAMDSLFAALGLLR